MQAVDPEHRIGELSSILSEAEFWIAGTAPITHEHLASAPKLRLIARYGAGFDGIDLDEANRRGILITNTPDANSSAVADHTLALILSALRRVPQLDRGVRAGSRLTELAREIGELTVGIVGLGRVGQAVARRLGGFGAHLVGYDPYLGEERIAELGVDAIPLAEMATTADIVTLHAPGQSALITSGWLAAIPTSLILVNTARASLVDESAIAEALRAGRLSMYASDVIDEDGRHESPLLHPSLENSTILTPHAAARTVEAVDRMGRSAVGAVLAVLAGQTPENIVNDPGASLVER